MVQFEIHRAVNHLGPWEPVVMPSIENHILRTLNEARVPHSPREITNRLNNELGGEAYTESEIEVRLRKMPNVKAVGDKYRPKAENASQAAARIVREATED
jgi:hypothetical protein